MVSRAFFNLILKEMCLIPSLSNIGAYLQGSVEKEAGG